MKYILSLALVVTLAGCSAPVTITTPQGQTAYRADQVVVRVNELQNAAIAANQATPKVLDDATARILVQFCVAADQTLAATPAGWQTTVKTAWASTKAQLPTITNPTVSAAIAAVDALMGALQ